ncbi:hypothetical protein ZWY2020_020058 [Hordeum vulgare]|nr:hypothetical protein ZWY2020_020058 [Hordeum vulgare]
MAPKGNRGKKGKVVPAEKELVKMQKEFTYFSPDPDAFALKRRYQFMWAAQTTVHPATCVTPGEAGGGPDKYPFFIDYFYCGPCPPFSEFFIDITHTYDFHLLYFTPNAVTCMSIFPHLCENFVGITPNTTLFRHYFTSRIQGGDALLGSITWIPRTGCKELYLDGALREKWEEWPRKWCWIREEGYLPFCEPSTAKIDSRDKHWSDLAPDDKKLTIIVSRILHLRVAGLTMEMVGADFIRRRIAPLQNRGKGQPRPS